MKKLYLYVVLFSISPEFFSQSLVRNQEFASHIVVGSYLDSSESLNLLYNNQMSGNTYTGSEDLRQAKFSIINNAVNQINDSLQIQDHLTYIMHFEELGNGNWYKAGGLADSALNGRSTIWYKIGARNDYDSIRTLPLLDSNFRELVVFKTIAINSSVYLFGGFRVRTFPFSKAFVLKHNLQNNSWSINSFFCFDFFGFIEDAIYDSLNANFIVSSNVLLSDSNPPFGAALAKIDTNLSLIPNTAQTISSNYQTHVINPPNPYDRQVVIEPSANGNFLAVGPVINFVQSFSATPNPNPAYYSDMAVAVRSMSSLQEMGTAYAYGRIDTAEKSSLGEQPFKKVENDLFYLAASKRFNNTAPERWNTDLALFALNNQGQKHWEYYLPLNDYCYIQDIHPTSSGGMWFVAQCSENLNPTAQSFDYFTKVGYIDSVYHWPRIGAVGIEAPQKKQEEIVVYPNPTTELLKIKQYGFIQNLQLKLYDLKGRLIMEQTEQSHIIEINIAELEPALYLLRVEDEQGGLVKEEKVMKR